MYMSLSFWYMPSITYYGERINCDIPSAVWLCNFCITIQIDMKVNILYIRAAGRP